MTFYFPEVCLDHSKAEAGFRGRTQLSAVPVCLRDMNGLPEHPSLEGSMTCGVPAQGGPGGWGAWGPPGYLSGTSWPSRASGVHREFLREPFAGPECPEGQGMDTLQPHFEHGTLAATEPGGGVWTRCLGGKCFDCCANLHLFPAVASSRREQAARLCSRRGGPAGLGCPASQRLGVSAADPTSWKSAVVTLDPGRKAPPQQPNQTV